MNPYKKLVLDIALYIVLFIATQFIVTIALAIGFLLYKGLPFTQLQTLIATNLTLTIVANSVS
ncbi:MAG: CPBP family intramembrane metalloprotease, partial [Prevotella sp.]|nr:CPBP family intramembrane metalloprotease [Prevotella sp.]